MMTKIACCFGRCALTGGAFVMAGMLVPLSQPSPAVAADFGEETYSEEVGGPRRGTTLNGRGHTFDEKPFRHPQSLRARPSPRQELDHQTYREDEPAPDYEQPYDEADRGIPYRGSIKDGADAPYEDEPRYGYREREYERDYADRVDRRWDNRWQRSEQCIPRRQLRRQLRRAGWRGFRRGRVRGNIGYLVARQRWTGEIYELAVDRCTGEVLSESFIRRGYRAFPRRGLRFRDFREDVVIHW